MTWVVLRSAVYHLAFTAWTLFLCIVYLPLLLAPRRTVQRGAALWLDGALWLQAQVLGLTFAVEGREHLPDGAAILAVKHQSAWETLVFHRLVGDPAFILKKELLSLPFIGWYLVKTGQVPIDRKAGVRALRIMVEGARTALAEGRKVVVFPEGHRQPPGATGTYQSGIAMLYAAVAAPVIPVAVNSGLFWSRNAFLRRPGMITLQFLPALPPGLDRKSFMEALQTRIETATRALERGGAAAEGVTDGVDISVERQFAAPAAPSVHDVDNPNPANGIKPLEGIPNVETK
jgi:1-acyl-sn-glycerol-3-phosphate acyltransferase